MLLCAFAVLLVAGVVGVLRGPDGEGDSAGLLQALTGEEQPAEPSKARDIMHRRNPLDPPRGRPALSATHPDENRHVIPPAQVSADYASGIVFDQQVVMADAAVPWEYWLDPAVAERFDGQVVHDGIAAWDGIAGSRWSTVFAGYRTAGAPVADGFSTIFIEASCVELTTANAYLFTDGGLGVDRYGQTTTQILEADIGICPRVSDPEQLQRAIRHEIGHVVGLGHLCDPGDTCWLPDMGEGNNCTVMFWQSRTCQTGISDGERLAAAALYPTIRRLDGPDAPMTAARASFAAVQDHAAPLAIVVRADVVPAVAAAAASLAGRTGGTVLLGDPDAEGCLGGVTVVEANRALTRRGAVVLVGDWPADACARLAYDWDITLHVVPLTAPVEAAAHLAAIPRPGPPPGSVAPLPQAAQTGAVLIDTEASPGVAASAGALAAARDQPLLVAQAGVLADRGLPDSVAALLRAVGGPVSVTLVGESGVMTDAVVEGLSADGVTTTRLTGEDPIAVSLVVADALVAAGRRGVVVTGVHGGHGGASAALVAARTGSAVLVSDTTADLRVLQWLADFTPTHGWAVGGEDLLPLRTLTVYGASVEAG
ncbi:hypothetical protein BH23ACT9_BH23ACT9_26400 [soil metagenome]